VWWELAGRGIDQSDFRGSGRPKGQHATRKGRIRWVWDIEQDVGWSGKLQEILVDNAFEENEADFMGQDCNGPTLKKDWYISTAHSDWLPADEIYHCQIPLARYSTRLLRALVSNQRLDPTHWSYCEITAPSVAKKNGWSIADYLKVAPLRFASGLFDWNVNVGKERYSRAQKEDTTGKLYHRLKW
jgi:hypothetical protein